MAEAMESRAMRDVIRDLRVIRDVAERIADVKANGDDVAARRKLINHVIICMITGLIVWLATRAWVASLPMATQVGTEAIDWLYKL